MKPTVSSTGMLPFLAVTGAPTEEEVRAKVAAIQAGGAETFMLFVKFKGKDSREVREEARHPEEVEGRGRDREARRRGDKVKPARDGNRPTKLS